MMYLHSHCLVSALFASIAILGVISKQPLYLLSYANSEDSIVNPLEGSSLTIAAQLAVNHINNNSDLLSDYELHLISQDSGCIALNYLSLFRDFIYSDKNIVGILGPGCSESSITLGSEIITTSLLQTLSVGISATQTLEQQPRFVNSFSTLDSTRIIAQALLRIISKKNWTRLFIAYDSTTSYYTEIFEQLNSSLPATDELQYIALHDSTLEFDVGTEIDCYETPRVFIIIAGSEIVKRIMCLFDQQRSLSVISYPTYQFVVVGQMLESVLADVTFEFVVREGGINKRRSFECSSDIITDQLNGSIFLLYNVEATTTNTISGLSHSQFVEEYNRNIQTYNNESSNNLLPSFYGAPFFDSVWALAIALNNSATDLEQNGLFDLSDYHYGDETSTEIIRNHLLSLDFQGISGRIRFSRNETFVPRVVDIFQVRNNTLVLLEYYNDTDDTLGNETAPYISDKFLLVTEKSLFTGAVLLVTIVLISIILIGFQLLSVAYVKHTSIRATSPRVYHLTYIACYILLSACVLKLVAIFFNLPEYALNSECWIDKSAEFLFGTGDVLLYATLAAISFRIYRIFVHYMNPGKFIQDLYLISFIVIITLVYIVCDAITIALINEDPRTDCVNVTENVMTVEIVCTYTQFEWYRVPNIIFPIVPSVLACVFSLLGSKKVSMKKFKTTSFALLCFIAYFNVATLTLFALINATSPTPALVIGSKLTLVICCILLLYLPPSWPIFMEWYTGSRLEQYYVSTRSCQKTDVVKAKVTITLGIGNKLNEVQSSPN